MTLLNTIRAITLILSVMTSVVNSRGGFAIPHPVCDKVTKDPFFADAMVIGKKWRAYYIWNLPSEEVCADITFKRAHPMMIESVRRTMRPYLASALDLDKATLFLKMGPITYYSLLIPDPSGVVGLFDEVTHIPQQHAKAVIPGYGAKLNTFKFAFKVLRGGRYLLFSDCGSGSSFLLQPQDGRAKPDRKEILEIARALDLGDGSPACVRD